MIANSTARLLITGSTPGIAVQTGQVNVLGAACVESTTAQPQNIFERVDSSAWTSRPITGSYLFSILLHKFLNPVQRLFDIGQRVGVRAAHVALAARAKSVAGNHGHLALDQQPFRKLVG